MLCPFLSLSLVSIGLGWSAPSVALPSCRGFGRQRPSAEVVIQGARGSSTQTPEGKQVAEVPAEHEAVQMAEELAPGAHGVNIEEALLDIVEEELAQELAEEPPEKVAHANTHPALKIAGEPAEEVAEEHVEPAVSSSEVLTEERSVKMIGGSAAQQDHGGEHDIYDSSVLDHAAGPAEETPKAAEEVSEEAAVTLAVPRLMVEGLYDFEGEIEVTDEPVEETAVQVADEPAVEHASPQETLAPVG